jgi:hypothetical protein
LAIDPFQEDVARIALAAAGEHGFALAGGNALVAHEVLDRETEDIDLFSPEPGGPGAVATVVRDALIRAGYTAEIIRPPEAHQGEYARLEVASGERVMHMDLARDWRQWPPVQLDIGPVLHLDDAASSKTNAMVTRYLPRDFIDVAAVLSRYSRSELMRLTFTRDPGLRIVDFTDAIRQLDHTPNDKFYKYGLTDDDVDAVRTRFADWPRHEADDQEGRAVHAALAEEERQRRAVERPPSTAELAGQAYPPGRTIPPSGSGPTRTAPQDRPPHRSL